MSLVATLGALDKMLWTFEPQLMLRDSPLIPSAFAHKPSEMPVTTRLKDP